MPTIINDGTPPDLLFPKSHNRGLIRAAGYEASRYAEPFPRELVIPQSEWQARTQEMRSQKTTLTDRCLQAKLKPKDQQQTNYCWVNSPTWCLEALRVGQNQAPIVFSPASAGGPITKFRNVGGLGQWAIDYIAENGVVPVDLWPANAIDSRYNTPENRAVAKKYRFTEWWILSSFDEVFSCLLRGWPVSGGFNWWSHQVSLTDPNWLDGEACVDIWNSWGEAWGDDGRGTLQGRKMVPDDAITPRVATAA